MSSSWRYPFPEASRRGWAFLPGTALDAFGRWDAHWYLDLAARGYELRGPLSSVQSNVAFFPLYPWAVGAVHALLPSAWRDEGSLYLCVIAVSNAAALLGLWLLWRLAREVTGEDDVASRTVLYAILFPTGFILSAPYPEALFLLLSVGVLVAVPLGWLAFTQGGPRNRGALPASALPGLGLALHAGQLWRITGNPLALFHAQSAWGHSSRSSRCSSPGPMLSSTRFAAVIFPAFLALAMLARGPRLDRAFVITFSFAQAVLFLFWSRFFWVA